MASGDFVFRRTVPGGVRALVEGFDFGPLAARFDLGWLTGGSVLAARTLNGNLAVYDASLRPRLELALAPGGYTSRGGVEYPAGGLLVVRAWTEEPGGPAEHDLRAAPVRLAPKP
jgi:hypothetical protein